MESNFDFFKSKFPNEYEEVRFQLLNQKHIIEEINKYYSKSNIKQMLRTCGGAEFIHHIQVMYDIRNGKGDYYNAVVKSALQGSIKATNLLMNLHQMKEEGSDDE